MKKQIKFTLIFALFAVALGGGWFHYTYHPFAKTGFGWVPFIAAIVSVLAVPLLFMSRKTVHWGYLLNGFTVIVGTVTMGHFSLALAPLWPDIAILWGKFAIGRALFCLEVYPADADPKPRGWARLRYPNLGFWGVHLALWSLVYFLGGTFWR
jgi:hypothetical protein